LLHQVGDLFELNVKLQCQKVKASPHDGTHVQRNYTSVNMYFITVTVNKLAHCSYDISKNIFVQRNQA